MKRLWEFVMCLRALHRAKLISRHNIRAAWIQTSPDPNILWSVAFLDTMTDEEWDRYLEAFE